MLGLLYLIVTFQYIFVLCAIPSLNVRKIDTKIVARKRQDTLDMCRLFNEETAKLQHQNHIVSKRFKRGVRQTDIQKENSQQRIKRSVKFLNKTISPAFKDYQTRFTLPTPVAKDKNERADQIVEMLYANLDAKGVTHNYKGEYRYYKTTGGSKKKGKSAVSKKPSRRFPFAPAMLVSATEDTPRSYIDLPYDEEGSTIRFKYGIIPYFIDPKTYDSHLSTLIISAFDYIEKATCIRLQRLRERPVDANSLRHVLWLYISNPLGLKQCVHSNDLAEMKGVQIIVFGYNCMSVGDIAHEIMHVLGFSHEHNRPDRDQFVSILWDNIKPGYRKFFEISNRQLVEGLPYDYNSVLHYPSRAFSRNGKLTISTDRGVKIGQRDGLSEIDIEKVSLVYSKECVRRNRDYLTKTCPTAVKAEIAPANITNKDIKDYFRERLWPLGRVYYRFRDMMEFSTIKGVARTRSTVSGRSGSRRHIGNVFVLTHSAEPGCKCPPPGKPNGNQILTVNTDCFNSVNDLLHLFGHVLGLDHQHNMYDRDSYLHINWENLTPDVNDDLTHKLPPAASVGFPYDYQSVMHFPWLQIKNGRTNIMYPIWNDGWAMGHWQGLSSTDVKKIDKLYSRECKNRRSQAQLNQPIDSKPTSTPQLDIN